MLTTIRLNNKLDRLDNSLWNIFDGLNYPEVDYSHSDYKETKDGYQLELNLAGIKKEDIKVCAEDGLLKVIASRNDKEYAQNFQIPEKADPSSSVARYEDGILYLKINKKQESKPVDIKIN